VQPSSLHVDPPLSMFSRFDEDTKHVIVRFGCILMEPGDFAYLFLKMERNPTKTKIILRIMN
jgi:hypothetical protein